MEWDWFRTFALIVSPTFSIILLIYYIIQRSNYRYKGMLVDLCMFCVVLFISNIIAGGDIKRCIGVIYPLIALQVLYILIFNSKNYKQTLLYISVFFFVMCLVNFVGVMTMSIEDGQKYFLGGENHVGYPLIVGLFYNLLYYRVTGHKKMLAFFFFLQVLTIFRIFSGSNVVGLLITIVLLSPFVTFFHRKITLNKMVITYFFIIFVVLVIGLDFMIYSDSFSSFLERTLGKDTTFSGRTEIWSLVLMYIYLSPIFGYGVLLDGSVFMLPSRWEPSGFKMDSSHNQILQTAYESGLITILFLYFMLRKLSILLHKSSDDSIKTIVKSVCIGILVMYLAEAPSLNPLLEIIIVSSIFAELEKWNEKKYIRVSHSLS